MILHCMLAGFPPFVGVKQTKKYRERQKLIDTEPRKEILAGNFSRRKVVAPQNIQKNPEIRLPAQ